MALVEQLGDDSWYVACAACCSMALVFAIMHLYDDFFFLFRPISLLSTLTKPLERHIHKHLTQFIYDRNISHPFQSGFRQRHPCHTALIRVCDTWLAAINQTQLTGAVFLDLKKAFDLVNHTILLQKLSIYLQNSSTMSLLKSDSVVS